MVSIKTRGLVKRFGDLVALDKLDLDVAPGEIFFLLGPSGCGKTTLLRSIAGFHIPDEGTILFDDENVTALPPHKRGTAMMFQSYALWPHLNVFKNVAFGLEEKKVPRDSIQKQVEDALEMVQMGGLGSRKINQLSGGQQQRVALARALVVRPRCLMLDEPLSNLDAKLRVEMRSEIRRICREFGLTAIYVTHDQKEALSIADRMAILDQGRFAQIGTPEDIYRNPTSPLVAGFIGETNFIPGEIHGKSGKYFNARTELGDFEGRLSGFPKEPQNGQKVTLSIRPECLVLGENASAKNQIAGNLVESAYLGEIAQYSLQSPGRAGGIKIRISELNPRRVLKDSGEPFFATAAPDDVLILPVR